MSRPQPKVERTCRFCQQPFQGTVAAGTCIRCMWRHRKRAPVSQYTPEMTATVARLWDPRVRGRIGEIARKIGRPRQCVTSIARNLGLARHMPSRAWTPLEVAQLEHWAAEKSVKWMAGRLNRSRPAVKQKLNKLAMSGRVDPTNTVSSLAVCFGVWHGTIEAWIKKGLLKGEHDPQKDLWVVSDEAILRFIRENPSAFCLYKVDQIWFLDLVFKGRIGEAK